MTVTVTEAGVTREVHADDRVRIPIDPSNSFPGDDIWSPWGWKGIDNDTEREWLACDVYLSYDRDTEELVIRGNQYTHGHGDKVEIRVPIGRVSFTWGNLGPRGSYEDEYIEKTGLNPYEEEFDANLLPDADSFFTVGEEAFGILANQDPSVIAIVGEEISYDNTRVVSVNREDREAVVSVEHGTLRLNLDTGEHSSSRDLEMVLVENDGETYVGRVSQIEVVEE